MSSPDVRKNESSCDGNILCLVFSPYLSHALRWAVALTPPPVRQKLEVESVDFTKQAGVPRLRLTWRATDAEPAVEQTMQLFSPVVVSLEASDMPLKFNTIALRPGAEPPETGAGLRASERRCVPTAELDEV